MVEKVIKNQIIGREREKERLRKIVTSQKAAFIAIYGRRRIGKTYLIREYFKERADLHFYVMGLNGGSTLKQLSLFQKQLENLFYSGSPLPQFKNWQEAFELLVKALKVQHQKTPFKNTLIFLDELPWLATAKSGLLEAIDHCWNTELKDLPFVKLVVCGSAASWMLKKVVNAKGGLHNRLTDVFHLTPFDLKETKYFLESKGIHYQPRQVFDLYMAFGGVPYYLDLIQQGKSPAQNIGEILFNKSPLSNEFENLFTALFTEGEHHRRIIESLARKNSGLLREEIMKATQLPSGGKFTTWLLELEHAGFIEGFKPYGKKTKQTKYRIIDEYLLFYFKWIQAAPKGSLKDDGVHYWMQQANSAKFNTWAGYAFENICLKHSFFIKKALGFSSISAEVGPWQWIPAKGSKQPGAQIDLIFDRTDKVISLCEMKYYDGKFLVTKKYLEELRYKKQIFVEKTQTRKSIFYALVTTEGLADGGYGNDIFPSIVTLEDFF